MRLDKIVISNVRNLKEIKLSLNPGFNVFAGENGSGKTSFLEALHILGMGRTFRAPSIKPVISFDAKQCVIRGLISCEEDPSKQGIWVGVEKSRYGSARYKVAEKEELSVASLAKLFPLQLIDINSHLLLEGGPNNRRQFIDWGLFHVEPTFLENWRGMKKSLGQRNMLLKQRAFSSFKASLKRQQAAWDQQFVFYAERVDRERIQFLENLTPILMRFLAEMAVSDNIFVEYTSGWDKKIGLAQELQKTEQLDLACGFTNRGSHRGDFVVKIGGNPVKSTLSRGQIKQFVCAMYIARSYYVDKSNIAKKTGKTIFLIDDLNSELDERSFQMVLDGLDNLGCQAFITGIGEEILQQKLGNKRGKMFHVERGVIETSKIL